MRGRLVLLLLLTLATAGCLGGPGHVGPVSGGISEDYNIKWVEGLNNTLSIYVPESGPVEVVHQVNNITEYELELNQGELSRRGAVEVRNITNLVLVPANDSTPEYTSNLKQEEFRIEINGSFTGIIAYEAHMAQHSESWLPTKRFHWAANQHLDQVRVILPKGYHANDVLLGRPSPSTENTSTLSDGREVLIWEDIDEGSFIHVKYYPAWAPRALRYFFAGVAAALIFAGIYHKYIIKQIREEK